MRKIDGTFEEDIQCIVESKGGLGAIFISNIEAASNPFTLQTHQIGAVITALKGKNLSQVVPNHIEYMYIPAVDHESFDISTFFDDSFSFIEEERKRTNVLVHCMAGVSRSVSLVIAYLIKKNNMPYEVAYAYVKSKRSIIHPNSSFVLQLKQFEKLLFQSPILREQNTMNKSAYFNQKQLSMSMKTSFVRNEPRSEEYEQNLKEKIKELFKMKKSGGTSLIAKMKGSTISMKGQTINMTAGIR